MYSQINIKKFKCYNKNCPDFGKKGKGNIFVKELRGKDQRALLKCKTCNKCFCETHGTPFFALKTSMSEIANTIVLIPELGSIRAVARYTKHKPDTIISWIELVNDNIEEFNEYFSDNFHFSQNRFYEMLSFINRRKRGSNNKQIAMQNG
jgi:transposase-like protein